MNFSRQALLGIGMILGGGVLLYAMVQQVEPKPNDRPAPAPAIVQQSSTEQPVAQPLTTDIETEKRILAQKQKQRAVRVNEQKKRAEQFLIEQGNAEAKALAKARSENEQYLANSTTTGGDSDSPEAAQNTVVTPTVQERPNTTASAATATAAAADEAIQAAKLKADEKATAKKTEVSIQALADDKKKAEADQKAQAEIKAAADKKAAEKKAADKKAADKKATDDVVVKKETAKSEQSYTIKSGDGLQKLSRQYNVSVAALAQANNIEPSSTLQIGQVLKVPSSKEIERLEREAAAAKKANEEKRNKEQAEVKKSADAQQNLVAARKEVKETDAKGSFGVQVALATNQAKADQVAKKYKEAGYKVKTVNVGTGRGVRVIVGPERGKVAALALKDKVNSDSSVDANGAWVRYWD